MERLTQWIDKEKAIPRVDLRECGHERCTTQLARYEDTNLTPEQVQNLKERNTAKSLDNSCTCDEKTHYKCPNCGEIIVTEYVDAYRFGRVTNFCEKCGQRLKMEEDS